MLDKGAILARHEFFRGMPPGTIDRLARHARPIAYRAGERIFARGDDGRGMMAVVSGSVRIAVASHETATELVLNLIGANEVFGELALLDGGPRSADAVAMTNCEVLLLERRDFLAVLADEPAVAVRLLAVLGQRLRRTSEQLQETRFAGAEQRLAKALLALAEGPGADARRDARVLITQRELGHMVGLSRESTNRHLRAWQAAGHVALEPGACTVRDRAALRRLADGEAV